MNVIEAAQVEEMQKQIARLQAERDETVKFLKRYAYLYHDESWDHLENFNRCAEAFCVQAREAIARLVPTGDTAPRKNG